MPVSYTHLLNEQGISAGRYHAGLSNDERKQNQEDFTYDRIRVMAVSYTHLICSDSSKSSPVPAAEPMSFGACISMIVVHICAGYGRIYHRHMYYTHTDAGADM